MIYLLRLGKRDKGLQGTLNVRDNSCGRKPRQLTQLETNIFSLKLLFALKHYESICQVDYLFQLIGTCWNNLLCKIPSTLCAFLFF